MSEPADPYGRHKHPEPPPPRRRVWHVDAIVAWAFLVIPWLITQYFAVQIVALQPMATAHSVIGWCGLTADLIMSFCACGFVLHASDVRLFKWVDQ